jgi:hypothetical protein
MQLPGDRWPLFSARKRCACFSIAFEFQALRKLNYSAKVLFDTERQFTIGHRVRTHAAYCVHERVNQAFAILVLALPDKHFRHRLD